MVVDIYSDLSYHLFMYFEWRLYYGMDNSKFIVVNSVEVKVRTLIELLAMSRGVYLKKSCVFFCACCLSKSLDEAVPMFLCRNCGV